MIAAPSHEVPSGRSGQPDRSGVSSLNSPPFASPAAEGVFSGEELIGPGARQRALGLVETFGPSEEWPFRGHRTVAELGA